MAVWYPNIRLYRLQRALGSAHVVGSLPHLPAGEAGRRGGPRTHHHALGAGLGARAWMARSRVSGESDRTGQGPFDVVLSAVLDAAGVTDKWLRHWFDFLAFAFSGLPSDGTVAAARPLRSGSGLTWKHCRRVRYVSRCRDAGDPREVDRAHDVRTRGRRGGTRPARRRGRVADRSRLARRPRDAAASAHETGDRSALAARCDPRLPRPRRTAHRPVSAVDVVRRDADRTAGRARHAPSPSRRAWRRSQSPCGSCRRGGTL